MPNHRDLRVGDKIRLLTVPACDLAQRAREMNRHAEEAGWTADTIERIIQQSPIVTINRIDEFNHRWFDCVIVGPNNRTEEHSLVILDDDSWEYVDAGS
jgi:hypothetical protein